MALFTLASVSVLTSGLLFKTLETVETETPECQAMSIIVTVIKPYRLLKNSGLSLW